MNKEIELAWAAGLFDGEGSFSFHKGSKNRNVYPQISIGQTDREVLDRFRDAVGVGKVYGPYEPGTRLGTKDWWQYHAHGAGNVRIVYEALYPYLGRIKREQGQAVFDRFCSNVDYRKTLTHVQRDEMFRLLADGARGCDISRQLGISTKIISYHKRKGEGKARIRHHETAMLDADVVDIESGDTVN